MAVPARAGRCSPRQPRGQRTASAATVARRWPRPRSRSGSATVADAEAIRAIYNHEVTHATSTFDLVPRTLVDQERWLAARSGAFSAIVAVAGPAPGAVVGFASLSPYKERAAYRTTVEDSVYVDRAITGGGVGHGCC